MSSSGLVDDINAMINTAEPPSTDDCCIYKVPSVIRRHNEYAYTPKVVSIGPFHHGHPQLQNMEIPQLLVDDRSEILFRNMVALEQCHYPDESYITDYRSVLDYLINTGKDVDILVQKKILENWLGDSDSVANMFNGLGKNVIRSNISSHFSILCKDLNAFCSNPWNTWKAALRRDYCKTPWQAAASFAGIVLLVLTFIQSVCSVLQVVQQPNAS